MVIAINRFLHGALRLHCNMILVYKMLFGLADLNFYPRDAMLAWVFAIATCLDVCLSVRLSHAGIVPSRAKAGS